MRESEGESEREGEGWCERLTERDRILTDKRQKKPETGRNTEIQRYGLRVTLLALSDINWSSTTAATAAVSLTMKSKTGLQ